MGLANPLKFSVRLYLVLFLVGMWLE